MIKRFISCLKQVGYCTITGAVILHATILCAKEPVDYLQYFDFGSINWTRGVLQGRGITQGANRLHNQDKIDLPIIEIATKNARRNLLRIAYKLRIDAFNTVEEILAGQDDIKEKVVNMVENAPITQKSYLNDGTIEVVVEMKIYDGFSQLILPGNIRQIATIKPILGSGETFVEESEDNNVKGQIIGTKYTGLIVNAVGLDAIPAMVPNITDENGEQVYGAAFASRNFAVQFGMCAYARNFNETDRVGNNPLVVRGIRSNGTSGASIVISNADASKIRSSSSNIQFLKQCRVMIIIDQGF